MHVDSLTPYRTRAGLALLLAAALFVIAGCDRNASAPAAPPPPEVTVQTVTTRRVAVINELPGRIEAIRVAEVRARVAGILLHRVFEEGADVKAGDVLFEIDPAPFQADLESAQANLAKAEAADKQAQTLADRYKTLLHAEAVSQQDYDNVAAAALQTAASVQAAKAAVTNAKLSLSYATVTAPISGRIGRALVTEGALVGQNETTPLAIIQQLDPVYFDFTESSTELLQLRRAMEAGRVKSLAPGTAQVTLLLEDGSTYQQPGKLLFSDITVDPNTSMVTLRAEFPNPDRLLLPGMFARGRLEQAVRNEAITVPMRAVARTAGGDATAYVVGQDNIVQLRNIKLGEAFEDSWVVTEGLRAGERVIVAGVQKVRPGSPVRPVTAEATPAQETPVSANTNAKK